MSDRRTRRLAHLLSDHQRAVAEFVTRAAAVDGRTWLIPRAEGKWTPAQETMHIILAYRGITRQLHETAPMPMHKSAVRRFFARLIGLTTILWFKRIPVAVNAPRAAQPGWVDTSSVDLLAELERHTQAFDAAFEHAWRHEPRRRMSHYLFGRLSLDQGIRLVTVHTRHHAAFLPSPSSSLLPSSSP